MKRKLLSVEWKHLIWMIPLALLLSPLFIIVFIIDFFSNTKRKKEAKKFFEDNQNKYYFFYSNKKSWGDFIHNNVIPVLPKDTFIYNIYKDKKNPLSTIYKIADIHKIPWTETKLPFIIKLCLPHPKIMTLQNDFSIVKRNAKRDDLIQAEIKQKLDKIIN
jgi:hypothetical protein